jgi:hypothetical protein
MERGDGENSRVKPTSGFPMEISDGLSYTGTKPMGLDAKTLKLNATWDETMSEHKKHFAICIDNTDYEASLILKKIYAIIPDEMGEKDDLLRIVDESGEDYLYHKSHFIVVEFPIEVEDALLAAERVAP